MINAVQSAEKPRTMHMAVLHHIDLRGGWDIRTMSEPFRQRVIDLGMMEPPLLDTDADHVFVTEAGKDALQKWRLERNG